MIEGTQMPPLAPGETTVDQASAGKSAVGTLNTEENHQPRGNTGPTVAVVGGGIAGITVAVKLYRQGYQVTLLEKDASLGGNLSSNGQADNGDMLDVYPHIFGDWYKEFWNLLETDLGLRREKYFLSHQKIGLADVDVDETKRPKLLSDVTYKSLLTPTSFDNVCKDLASNILKPRDMFLYGYSYLDNISTPQSLQRLKVLNELDVTGYLYSRPFMNDTIADLHDNILKVIWSSPAELTSAQAYQNLIRHTLTFPNASPFGWLARGPMNDILMYPIQAQLEARGCTVLTGCTVTQIELDYIEDSTGVPTNTVRPDSKVTLDWVLSGGSKQVEPPNRTFNYVVVATPANAALKLSFHPQDKGLIRAAPELALLRQAETTRIPVMYLRFTEAFLEKNKEYLGKFPTTMTGFQDAVDPKKAREGERRAPGAVPGSLDLDISILNLNGIWDKLRLEQMFEPLRGDDEPILVLAASRADSIAAPEGDTEITLLPGESYDCAQQQGWRMVQLLAKYWPFIDPGTSWGKGNDIDWERTRVVSNEDHLLFLNDAGGEEWRPSAVIDKVPNVFFAGDYCLTDVDMPTVEAAVQSGVLAARAVQKSANDGDEILLQSHDIYATSPLLLAKLALAPAAFAAAVSAMYDEARADARQALVFQPSVAALAASCWADWLKSAIAFWSEFLPSNQTSPSGPASGNVADHDNRIGLVGSAANLASAIVLEGPALVPALRQHGAEALYGAWRGAIGKRLFPGLPDTLGAIERSAPTAGRSAASQAKPNSWSGLIEKALNTKTLSPKSFSDAAFGVAATCASFLESLKALASAKAADPATAATKMAGVQKAEKTATAETTNGDQSTKTTPFFSKAFETAIAEGARARRDKAKNYVGYDAKNEALSLDGAETEPGTKEIAERAKSIAQALAKPKAAPAQAEPKADPAHAETNAPPLAK